MAKYLCVLLVIPFAVFSVPRHTSEAASTNPAMFIFGDSTVDVGTNSYLNTSLGARADFPYNGIDFPNSKPTGRFSNGLNTADFLAKLMGQPSSPQPFFFLQKFGFGKDVFRGVNFASGGSGLLDVTGQKFNIVVPLSEQINQLATVRTNITSQLGAEATEKLFSNALFVVSVGSNDIFEYNRDIPPDNFIVSLSTTYDNHIKALYNLGARKFGIISPSAVGCCPARRLYNSTGGCLELDNMLARALHSSLSTLLHDLGTELPGMKYALGNTYLMTINAIEDAPLLNYIDVKSACCGSGRLNAEKYCTSSANLCSNRENYLFWDMYHPAQSSSNLSAQAYFLGGPPFVTPITFAQLASAS